MKRKGRGFTLIELLIVVLIIGILAAVALPQYQKSVVRSRNTALKQLVKSVGQAEESYYLANGKYAANFNQLDIDLSLEAPGSKGTENTYDFSNLPCRLATMGTDAIRQGKDFYIVLNATNLASTLTVKGVWTEGPYRCAGFMWNVKNHQLYCWESNYQDTYPNTPGAFCVKIEKGTQIAEGSPSYLLP